MDVNRVLDLTGLSVSDLAIELGKSNDTIYRWKRGDGKPDRGDSHLIREIVQKYMALADNRTGRFRFIDLFAGIGGFRLAFESIGGECVFTSEWDRFAQRTYTRNFQPADPVAGDITKIRERDIPLHDVLVAGFPCQPFSIAGVSKKTSLGRAHGFLDLTQGTLFFDVARIIKYHQPRFFLLENVKNLLSHDRGRTFKVIRQTLEEELGYHIQYRVIDARKWVPQHRERIFIIGFREPTEFEFASMPIPAHQPVLGSILHPEDGSEEPEEPYTAAPDGVVSGKYTLTDRLWEYLQEYSARHRARGNGFGYGLFDGTGVARTLSARYYKDGSEILIERPQGNPRRLTPRECARLMGFEHPDGRQWEIPVSDVQAYRQFGNAVVVPVVKHIAHHVSPHLYSPDELGYQVLLAQLNLDGQLVYSHA